MASLVILCMFCGRLCVNSLAATNEVPAVVTNALAGSENNPAEKYLSNSIVKIKAELADPALTNPIWRASLERNLASNEKMLNRLREFEISERQRREVFNKQIEERRQAILAAHPSKDMDTVDKELKEKTDRVRALSARTSQCWSNYHRAKTLKDPDLVAKTERELADNMIAFLEYLEHKKYPKDMPLQQVLDIYRQHLPSDQRMGPINKKTVVIAGLAAVLLLPALILLTRSRGWWGKPKPSTE